jgi:DNA replication and repair protein RecF
VRAGVADRKGGSMTVGESERSVWVRRLFLSCFRSYLTFDLSLDRRPPGQGLRGARLSELLHRGGPAAQASPASLKWAVSLELETPRGCRSLGTALDTVADGRERRSTKIDGEPQRGQASLGEVFRLVWLTPQMDGLLREGPADRRRFLDRLVCAYDPAHASRGHAYDYAQRQRARLFREGIEDPAWLASLEDAMARHGVAQVAARRELVTRLTRVAAGFGPFPSAQLDIECPIDSWLGEAPALGPGPGGGPGEWGDDIGAASQRSSGHPP